MQAAETSDQDFGVVMAKAAALSEQLSKLFDKLERPEPEDPKPEEARPKTLARNCVEPPARLHRWLRVAYLRMKPIDNHQGTGVVLDRAAEYGRYYQRVSCRECDGEGVLEPTPEAIVEWDIRIRPLLPFHTEEAIEELLGESRPEVKSCWRCKGSGTQKSWDGRCSARPSGSSVPQGSPQTDPVDVFTVARMGHVVSTVQSMDASLGLVLRAYYGDDHSMSALALSHGRLMSLYPMTETGQRLLADWDGSDPWDALATHITHARQSNRQDDEAMAREAYQLLMDATDVWDQAVGKVVPSWDDLDQDNRRLRQHVESINLELERC